MFPKELEFYQRRANVFCGRVKDEIYSDRSALRCEYAASKDPVEFKNRLNLTYKPIAQGEKWGENWESAWFHVTGTIPERFAGKEIALLVNVGGEALIFDTDSPEAARSPMRTPKTVFCSRDPMPQENRSTSGSRARQMNSSDSSSIRTRNSGGSIPRDVSPELWSTAHSPSLNGKSGVFISILKFCFP